MGRGLIAASAADIHWHLLLPSDAHIVGAFWDVETNSAFFIFLHPAIVETSPLTIYAPTLMGSDTRTVSASKKVVVWEFDDQQRRISSMEDLQPVTMTPYKFPQALTDIGAVGEEGKPVADSPFYRLNGATVRRGVGAFMVITVIGKNGAPVIGATVVNLFPDGKGDVPQQTDGSGVARFQFGPSSAFTTPGTGPFTVFITDWATKDEDTKLISFGNKLSDIVHSLGDFQGTHTETYLQFVEQDGADAPPPPTPTGLTTEFKGVTAALAAKLLNYEARKVYPNLIPDYNPDYQNFALYRRAMETNLGVARIPAAQGEHRAKVDGTMYAFLPCELGTVYCIDGKYELQWITYMP